MLAIQGATDPSALCRRLCEAPFAKQLKRLELSHGSLDDVAARILAGGSFPALEELDASNNQLTDAGYAALDEIKVLDLVDDRRYDDMAE